MCKHYRKKKKKGAERKEGRKEPGRTRRQTATGQSPDAEAARKGRPTAGAGVRGYIRQVPATHSGINVPPYRYRYNMQMCPRDGILTQRYVLFWIM